MTQEAKSAATPPEEEQGQHAPQTTPPDAGQGNDFEKVTGGQAEYTRKMQVLGAIEQEAKDAGFDDPQEYVASLRDEVFSNKIVDQVVGKEKPPDKKLEPKPDDAPKTPSEIAALKAEITALREDQQRDRQERARQMLATQFKEFRKGQEALPEGERMDYSRDDLMKYMEKNQPIISAMAQKEMERGRDVNLWEVAAQCRFLEKSRHDLIKEGAKTQDAINREADASKLRTSQSPPVKSEEKRTEQEVAADKIAPDTPYEMPS